MSEGRAHGREVVRRGYDAIGRRYQDRRQMDVPTRRFLDLVLDAPAAGGRVLDLGCGPGRPVTAALATRHRTVGVDISSEQLRLARAHAPGAALVQADIAEVEFRAEAFDAVVAFYSLTHVPRDLLPVVCRRIITWLRRGGMFVASLGAREDPGTVEEDWLGVPMFFSHFDAETNLRLLGESGFVDVRSAVVTQEVDDHDETFLWIAARAP